MKSNYPNPFVQLETQKQNVSNPGITTVLSVTYSQCCEDAIIDGLFRTYLRRQERDENELADIISYVEIGANHPIAGSSTYYFYQKYNCSGLLVEANPKLIDDLVKVRPRDQIVNCAITDTNSLTVSFYLSSDSETSSLNKDFVERWNSVGVQEEIVVPAQTINQLLANYQMRELTLLSIDVEGYDLNILNSMDFTKFRPFLIQLEPSDQYRPGTSQIMINKMEQVGYQLAGLTDVNLIFQNVNIQNNC